MARTPTGQFNEEITFVKKPAIDPISGEDIANSDSGTDYNARISKYTQQEQVFGQLQDMDYVQVTVMSDEFTDLLVTGDRITHGSVTYDIVRILPRLSDEEIDITARVTDA